MLERKYSTMFRAELQEVLGTTANVHLIRDVPRSGKKQYDAYMVWRSWHVSLEFKVAKGASVSYTSVTHHQKMELMADEQAGGISYIVIYMVRTKKTLFITPNDFERLFDEGNVKNIKVDLIEQMCYRMFADDTQFNPVVIERTKWFSTIDDKGNKTKATKWFFPLWLKTMEPEYKRFDYAL